MCVTKVDLFQSLILKEKLVGKKTADFLISFYTSFSVFGVCYFTEIGGVILEMPEVKPWS